LEHLKEMTTKTRVLSIGVIATLLTLAGCAKPPETEIASSRAALSAAEMANAAEWAPGEWRDAEAATDAVDQELAAQAEKFAITRSYDRTSELVASAVLAAETAQAAAVENKQAARREAEAALASADEALASARRLSAHLDGCRSKPKGFAADMAVVAGTLDALQSQLGTARSQYEQEQFLPVGEESEAIRRQVEVVSADLLGVMQKIRCAPPATI